MTVNIISRTTWGARAPKSVTHVALSERREFIVHYSAANKAQTVRAIQNFHMDTKGWTDIGYNFLCDHLGRLYMGRGWNALGTHTVGFNRTGIAVCFIGTDADVTDAGKRSIRWLADEANRLTGRTLQRGGHRDYDQTSCPGANLYAWVHSGMRVQEGDDDMTTAEQIHNVLAEGWSILTGAPASVIPYEKTGVKPVPIGNPLWDMLRAIAAKVDIDPDELAAITAAARAGAEAGVLDVADDLVAAILAGLPEGTLTRDDVEAAIRTVLGGLDAGSQA